MRPFNCMPTVRTPEAPCRRSPPRDARCCLPPWEMGSATPTTIDFGAIFPFTCVPAYSFPAYASQRAVTGRHARLGTRLLARPCRGCHFRRLCLTSFQGATPHRSVRAALLHTAPTSDVWRRSARSGADAESGHSESTYRPAAEIAPRSAASAGGGAGAPDTSAR